MSINHENGNMHEWDKGVAYFTGSLEGQDGTDARRAAATSSAMTAARISRTCGPSGDSIDMTLGSRANHKLRAAL